ncbi:unnamed protein product [Phytophthora fragariaefolia]|uniref:Unnamed protein product n=1 Tax=Phytophthora fragariaefolia TaxID=1490495 RepID=A0A9W6XLJ3_9STRA|nr:unnamed protein product [Phytophthora fragariaefolia]
MWLRTEPTATASPCKPSRLRGATLRRDQGAGRVQGGIPRQEDCGGIAGGNAPAHSQTETLVPEHDDLVLLRLGPYSPMCNPIENCFSSLKANIKQYLALARDEVSAPMKQLGGGLQISKTEARMHILERAAHVSMPRITQCMVQKMELHASKFVNAAIRMEDMKYVG